MAYLGSMTCFDNPWESSCAFLPHTGSTGSLQCPRLWTLPVSCVTGLQYTIISHRIITLLYLDRDLLDNTTNYLVFITDILVFLLHE